MKKGLLSKELTLELKYQAARDYWDWGEWGRAELAPFRVVRWVSKEKSARMKAQIAAIVEKWKAILAKTPETKAYDELYSNGETKYSLAKQNHWYFTNYEDNAIEDTVLGEKLYVRCLMGVTEGKRKKRVRPMSGVELSFKSSVNFAYAGGRYGHNYDHLKIYWDEDRQQYKVAEYIYVGTDGMTSEEIRNRRTKNWPRAKFKEELKKKAIAKARELVADGVTILGIKDRKEHPGNDYITGYIRSDHNYFIDCVAAKEIA